MTDRRPLDARLAARLVYPLRHSPVSPNHLTTLRLLSGLAACVFLASGDYARTNAGAVCFVVSNFLDHADGELARLTGNTSRTGYYYDLGCDALVNILLFTSIGIGLMQGSLGGYALLLGGLAGVGVAAIFYLHLVIENTLEKDDARRLSARFLESEDILYLLPVVTLFDQLQPFLILAAGGAPLFALWSLRSYLALRQ